MKNTSMWPTVARASGYPRLISSFISQQEWLLPLGCRSMDYSLAANSDENIGVKVSKLEGLIWWVCYKTSVWPWLSVRYGVPSRVSESR